LRIIVVTNRFGDVGTHPQLTRIALHLKAHGHDVTAVSLAATGSIADMFAEADIDVEVIDASRRGSFAPVVGRLTALFRRVRPDAVVAFLYESIMPARFAARLAGVPCMVSSIRNEWFGRRHRERLLRSTERLSAVTVVNSQRVADSLVRRGIASRRHLVVIHNGVDASRFESLGAREDVRSSLVLADEDFVWLTIGRLAEQKAYPNLIRAFSTVLEEVPTSKLLVVGRGPLRAELESLVRASGLQASISFLGFRRDVPSVLSAADAFVMASRYEGMPNAIMEAMASGLPVVATDVGGVPDLIQEGVNGYLVPPSDPRALGSALTKLALASPQERLEMGQQGRTRVRDLCDLELVMNAWTALIEESVRSGSARRSRRFT
jgi:glycosyltransferase involved in cell wall biosynthesis